MSVRILAVSDRVVKWIYSPEIDRCSEKFDLVISCGDLPYTYMEYIVTMSGLPAFYVHGNHDHPEYLSGGMTLKEPGGWVNLDGRVVKSNGLLIAGLEGSIRYRPDGDFQYTEFQMLNKIWRLAPKLLWNRTRYGRYLDILVTHSPPFDIHDGTDTAHRGFKVFRAFMRRFRPRYLLHGHKQAFGSQERTTRYLDTEVVNVLPYRVVHWRKNV